MWTGPMPPSPQPPASNRVYNASLCDVEPPSAEAAHSREPRRGKQTTLPGFARKNKETVKARESLLNTMKATTQHDTGPTQYYCITTQQCSKTTQNYNRTTQWCSLTRPPCCNASSTQYHCTATQWGINIVQHHSNAAQHSCSMTQY